MGPNLGTNVAAGPTTDNVAEVEELKLLNIVPGGIGHEVMSTTTAVPNIFQYPSTQPTLYR